MQRPTAFLLLLAISLCAIEVLSGCPDTTAAVRYSTWAGKAKGTSDAVNVPSGTAILFDESPGFVLNRIDVYGIKIITFLIFSLYIGISRRFERS